MIKRLKNADLNKLGCDKIGANIMKDKMAIYIFEIKDLSFIAMEIIKQEAISVGGDFATPRSTIKREGEKRGILIATKSQLKRIIYKLELQPFGLKEVAHYLKEHLEYSNFDKELMAIVNINSDSFFKEYSSKDAIDYMYKLLDLGVAYIDIGVASSAPNKPKIQSDLEINRLKDIATEIDSNSLYKKARFSIDSYNLDTAIFALKHGFSVLNDVSALADISLAKAAKEHNATYILMHSHSDFLGNSDVSKLPQSYEDIVESVDIFFEQKLEILEKLGVCDIILDVGFGFAKNMEQNMTLIKNLEHFRRFKKPLLVGASNKKTIGEITDRDANMREYGTLALHTLSVLNGADILRVHNVDSHIDMLKILNVYQSNI